MTSSGWRIEEPADSLARSKLSAELVDVLDDGMANWRTACQLLDDWMLLK
jgi:hypothetical protein